MNSKSIADKPDIAISGVHLTVYLALLLPVLLASSCQSAEAKKMEKNTSGSSVVVSRDKTAKKKDASIDQSKNTISQTEHSIEISGQKIDYTAKAGYMILKDFEPEKKSDSKSKENDKEEDKLEDHRARARMFYVSYTKNGSQAENRPLAFAFNGGPGSASVWLHMGGLGPKRAVLSPRGEALPPPYKLESNAYSWLDRADLVFIDPVSTGYSRAVPGVDAKKFHGYKEDIESVSEFIRLYITENKRWESPKFLIGESYGTTRAAGLSEHLSGRYGITLNGIVLVSSVLNFATLDFAPNNDTPYLMFLPSYCATAWYHKKLSPAWQSRPLSQVLEAVEDFTANEYLNALFAGDTQPEETKMAISERLSEFTGLPSMYIKKLDNRISDRLFFTHLMLDEDKQIGRFDSRYSGPRFFPGQDRNDYDPSFEAVSGSYTATLNHYLRSELDFKSELPYETLAKVWPWSFKDWENSYLNVAEDLRKAMIRNPYLKIWICSGYYDLATPYFASKYTVNHMRMPSSIRNNLKITYYDSGHMMYVNKPDLIKLKSDFLDFLDNALLTDSETVPSVDP